MMVKSWIKCFSTNLEIAKCTYLYPKVRIRDFTSLIWLYWFVFRLKSIFATIQGASKILLASKVVKSDLKIINNISQFEWHNQYVLKEVQFEFLGLKETF